MSILQSPSPAPTFDDVWRALQELALRSKETDKLFQETAKQMQETDKQVQATSRQVQATERTVKNLSKNLGDLGNRLGEFVEYMVAPAAVRIFQSQGVEVHEVHQSIAANRDDEGIEVDLLVVNDGVLVAVECKSKLTQDHVDEHMIRMEKLKRLLPSYRHHRALGAVAGMVIPDSVKKYAHQQGLYVLVQNGENVDIETPTGFAPKTW